MTFVNELTGQDMQGLRAPGEIQKAYISTYIQHRFLVDLQYMPINL